MTLIEKYLALLEDDIVYSVSTIPVSGSLDEKRRARNAFARLAKLKGFPREGDGLIKLAGQVPLVGWFGWRWKDFERVFEPDEMIRRHVAGHWKCADLLEQEGIFALKDVAGLLHIDSTVIKKRVRALERTGEDAWKVMGARKSFGSHSKARPN